MAGITNAMVQDGRITFPEGTKTKEIKPICKECPLNTSCLGPDSKGFADIDLPRGTNNTKEYIVANAACLKSVER